MIVGLQGRSRELGPIGCSADGGSAQDFAEFHINAHLRVVKSCRNHAFGARDR